MGLLDLLLDFAKDKRKDPNDTIFEETARDLGLTPEEIKDCKESGISPEEWLEENDPENYHDQGLDE